jgi:carbon storage regulator
MLILTRTSGKRIFIGEDIVITVVQIKNHQVSIGIDAPGLSVDREEVRISKNSHHEESGVWGKFLSTCNRIKSK